MRIYRDQSFQKGKPDLRKDGTRSPIAAVDVPALRRIQRGAMHHYWRGVMCNKNPFDIALYSRLIWELKPATIIEIGYKFGGSALWFADQAQAMGLETRLYCLDVEQREEVSDPRITFTYGDGRDLGATLTPEILASLPHPWLVVEDADHHYLTTLAVLAFFAPHMRPGDYMAVEDGICDSFGNEGNYDGGPNRSLDEFLTAHPDIYEIDAEYCDYFGHNVTWCTNGWLRRSAAIWAGEDMTQQKAATPEGLDAAKTALARRDWATARQLLTPLVASKPDGTAAFFLARAELGEGHPDAAEPLLDAFQKTRPKHAGARMMRARIHLARGQLEKARSEAQTALGINPDLAAAQTLLLDIAATESADQARKHIAVIDKGYLKARDNGPTKTLLKSAQALAQLVPGPKWNDDPVQATIAYFHHAPDLEAALRNYDPHLIAVSTDFDYITWPKRIQEFVKGKSVIDVGCGFGGYGMGFLVAGATDYTGLDPVMKLDSTRAKNKRTRVWSDMGVTPRKVADTLPAIHLFEGTSEDLSFDQKFDTIALHNVTEHLIQLDLVFEGLVPLCKPDTTIVYLHHNFYCWNGHHFSPNRPDQLDMTNPDHQQVYDWRHIDIAPGLPEDHYFKTYLNRVRLDEIRTITEKHFEVETWLETPSSKETLARLTPEILDRVRQTQPDLQERDLTTNVVFCVAKPKKKSSEK